MFMSSCIFLTTLTSFQFFYLWWENMNISEGAWVLPAAAVWRRKQKISLALIIIIPCLVTSPRSPIGQHALSWPVIGWAGITNNCREMSVLPSGVSLLSQHFTFSKSHRYPIFSPQRHVCVVNSIDFQT